MSVVAAVCFNNLLYQLTNNEKKQFVKELLFQYDSLISEALFEYFIDNNMCANKFDNMLLMIIQKKKQKKKTSQQTSKKINYDK